VRCETLCLFAACRGSCAFNTCLEKSDSSAEIVARTTTKVNHRRKLRGTTEKKQKKKRTDDCRGATQLDQTTKKGKKAKSNKRQSALERLPEKQEEEVDAPPSPPSHTSTHARQWHQLTRHNRCTQRTRKPRSKQQVRHLAQHHKPSHWLMQMRHRFRVQVHSGYSHASTLTTTIAKEANKRGILACNNNKKKGKRKRSKSYLCSRFQRGDFFPHHISRRKKTRKVMRFVRRPGSTQIRRRSAGRADDRCPDLP
jgi:hypothetical protein